MPVPPEAEDHALARQRLALAAAADAARRWAYVEPDAISASWLRQVPATTLAVTGAQYAAAARAEPAVSNATASWGEYTVAAVMFAGVAADGRPLETLLYRPVITALMAVEAGRSEADALASGLATLDMTVRTEVADAGRAADQVAITTRDVEGYIRVVVGPTCSRCVILAGRWYPYSAGFARHP